MFDMFGSSRAEIWSRFAAELNGEYEENFWTGGNVSVHAGSWTVHLDSTMIGKVPRTRFGAGFVSTDYFLFEIYRKSIFSGLGKMLGMQDIEMGDFGFDEDFIIRSNSEEQARALPASERLRERIQVIDPFHLEAKADSDVLPGGPLTLEFLVPGVIRDINERRAVPELFGECLSRLCEIGSARGVS